MSRRKKKHVKDRVVPRDKTTKHRGRPPEPKKATPPPGTPILQEGWTDPHRQARDYLKRNALDGGGRLRLRYWRREWYRHEDGRYRKIEEDTIRVLLTAFIRNFYERHKVVDLSGNLLQVRPAQVTSVLQALKSIVGIPEETEMPAWLGKEPQGDLLAMANGLIDIKEILMSGAATVRPHSPEWFSLFRFPYPYDPKATCPHWERFLEEVLEGDSERIAIIQEFMGYTLTPTTEFHKFLLLEGEGANGKSVILDVIAAMLGEENCSHIPLGVFGERFQLTPTIGKLANIAPETDDTERPNIGILKQFVAGDRAYYDRKGIPGVEARPTARLIMASNNRPAFADGSLGLWRRMLLIPFRITIPEDKQDRQLAAKLKGELSGIFNWALAGLKRLKAQNGFTHSAIVTAAQEEYRLESNPARTYLMDHFEVDHGSCESTAILYSDYSAWAKTSGYQPLDAKQFGKEVRRAFPHVKRLRRDLYGIRQWAYVGLRTTRDDSSDPRVIFPLNSLINKEVSSKS